MIISINKINKKIIIEKSKKICFFCIIVKISITKFRILIINKIIYVRKNCIKKKKIISIK